MDSSHKTTFVQDSLNSIEKGVFYRALRTVVVRGATATVDGRHVIHLCSNDYLGLSQNKHVIDKTVEALYEVSQCSSRLIAGNHPKVIELEGLLADHRKTESALVYPTGYSANLGIITTIADKKSTIFSDELNHASIVDACRLSGAKIVIFRHNDMDHLEELIRQIRGRKIVVTEGIFSMDGDMGKISEIHAIANNHDAITVIDDAHGDFIVGPCFSGVPAKLGIGVDIHVSSLSKGLGCFGGYVATTRSIRELLINKSRQFIYTSALPDHLCSAAIAALPIAKNGKLQKRLQWNTAYFSSAMKELGFELANTASQIIPIIVGQERTAMEFSKELLKEGVFAQAIRYPTVRKGHARIRISITAMHQRKHLEHAAGAFEKAARRAGIL
ncbi:MAG: aminotransferase class I/II-fold pyridoxal phosphate-dependent enzyme [Thermoproteota archaeon]|nr:aminotransferase class I/II-fold pyridoxal phosphate-dependent enzyme [Thermoproteota archaeon]